MSMFGGGGGGTNLPPLIQKLNIMVVGQNAAVQALNAARQASGSAIGGLNGLAGASNMASQAFLGQQIRARMMADSMRQLGSLMQYTIIMPLMNVGMTAVKTAVQFEDAMAKIRGLVGATSADMAMFQERLLTLGPEVAKSPIELADALYYVTSAGFEGKAAMDVVEASAKAAAAGLGETATIADTLTSVLNAYSTAGYKATQVTDILVAAVREGKAEPQDMAGAMGKIVPVAATFGVSVEDVAAAIASMTRQGAVASTAAIYLRQVLNTLLDPTVKAEDALRSVGMSAQGLRTTIQEEGLLAGLEQLYTAFNGNAESIATVFGNVRAMTAVFSLMGPNLEANRQIFEELGATAGDTDAALKEMQKTAGFKMKQASAQLSSAMVKMGQALYPLVQALAGFANLLAKALTTTLGNTVAKSIIVVVGTLTAFGVAMSAIMRLATSFYRMKLLFTTVFRGIAGGVTDNFKTFAMLQNQMGSYYQAQMMGMQATVNATAAANAQTTVNIKQSMSERELITALISKNETNATNIALMHMATNASTQHGTAAALDADAILAQARSMGIASGQAVGLTAAMRGLMLASVGVGIAFMAWPMISGWFKSTNKEMATTQQLMKGLEEIGGYALKPIVFDQSIQIAATIDTGPDIKAELEKKLDEEIDGVDYTLREKIKQVNETLQTRQDKIDWASSFLSFDLGNTDPKLKKEIASYLADAFNINASEITQKVSDINENVAKAIKSGLISTGKDITEIAYANTDGIERQYTVLSESSIKAISSVLSVPIEGDSVSGLKTVIDQTMQVMGDYGVSLEGARYNLGQIMRQTLKDISGKEYEGNTIIDVLTNAVASGDASIPPSIRNMVNAFSGMSAAQKIQINLGYTDYLDELAQKEADAADTTLALASTADKLNKEFETSNAYFEEAVQDLEAVDAAMERVKKQQESMTRRTTDYVQAGIDARDAVRGMIDAVQESGGRLLDGTKLTDEALGTVIDASQAALDAANALFAANPDDAAKAINVYADSYTNLINKLTEQGVSQEEIKRLVDEGAILSVEAFGESLQGGEGLYADSIESALTNAYAMAKPKLYGIGEDITNGILYGMTHTSSTEMRYQTTLLMNELVAISQEILGIKSPSKVFADLVGVPITEGIAQGIVDAADQQESTIKKAVDIIIGAAQDAVSGVSDAISGQLNFAQAQADLAKFQNTSRLYMSEQQNAMAAVSEARFKFGGGTKVTAYERSQLDELKTRMEESRRAYQMGRGSYSDFIDAQYEYNNAVREAKQPSKDLVDAQNDVIDANYNVNTASLQLMDAQNGVASAFLDMVEAATTLALQGQKARDTFNSIAAAAGLTQTAIQKILFQSYLLAQPNLMSNIQLQDIFPGIDLGNLPKAPSGGGGGKGGKGGDGGSDDEEDNPGGTPVLTGERFGKQSVEPELFISRTTAKVGKKTALNAVTRTSVPAGYAGTMNNSNTFNITVNNPTPEPASDSIVRRTSAAANAGQFG